MARLRRTPEVGDRLAELGAVAWRRRMVVLLVAALTTVGALGWALAQPTEFTASSRVLLPSITAKEKKALTLAGLDGGVQMLSIQTQAQLIGSPVVAAQVSEAIQGKLSTEELTRAVDAEVVGANQVRITARAPRAVLAQAEANAFADAYLAYRAASRARDVSVVLQAVAEQRAAIDRQIADADRTIEASMVGLSALPPMELADTEQQAASASLRAEQERAEAERTRLQEARLALTGTESGLGETGRSVGTVVARAALPRRPSGPEPLGISLAGLAGGLLLGLACALLLDRISDRVGLDDETWTDGAPVLARLPRLRSGTPAELLVATPSDGGDAAEAYRTLREALAARGLGERFRILLVTSPGRREGKSTTAANLATALAGSGLTTIAVSANLRRPRLGTVFGLDDAPGLIEVLDGKATLQEALRGTGIPNLRVLPSSAERHTGSDRLATPAFALLLRHLADEAEVVVVDAAAVADGADASILAGLCGSSLLVVQEGVTLAGAAGRAVQALVRAGAAPLGAVVSPAPPVSARMRLAVSSLGAVSVLLGSVVWANGNGVEERSPLGTNPAAAPGTPGFPVGPDASISVATTPPLDDAAKAALAAQVAPLLAAADPPGAPAAPAGGPRDAGPDPARRVRTAQDKGPAPQNAGSRPAPGPDPAPAPAAEPAPPPADGSAVPAPGPSTGPEDDRSAEGDDRPKDDSDDDDSEDDSDDDSDDDADRGSDDDADRGSDDDGDDDSEEDPRDDGRARDDGEDVTPPPAPSPQPDPEPEPAPQPGPGPQVPDWWPFPGGTPEPPDPPAPPDPSPSPDAPDDDPVSPPGGGTDGGGTDGGGDGDGSVDVGGDGQDAGGGPGGDGAADGGDEPGPPEETPQQPDDESVSPGFGWPRRGRGWTPPGSGRGPGRGWRPGEVTWPQEPGGVPVPAEVVAG